MKVMTNKAEVEREVLKTLELLERPDELPADPHFYGRVMARLAESRRPKRAFLAVLKPALIAVLVVANLITAVWYLSGRDRRAYARDRQRLIETLAGDLNLADDGQPLFFNK